MQFLTFKGLSCTSQEASAYCLPTDVVLYCMAHNRMLGISLTDPSQILLVRDLFTQPPIRQMRICFTDVFFCFLPFPFATKIPDNCSGERLNGFS